MALIIESWAILELSARMLYFVSSDAVKSTKSLNFWIGDLPLFVIVIVVAPVYFASFNASTIYFEEPEWDIAITTSSSVKWDATITCMWLSEYAYALHPARRSLWLASSAIDAEFPRPNITILLHLQFSRRHFQDFCC